MIVFIFVWFVDMYLLFTDVAKVFVDEMIFFVYLKDILRDSQPFEIIK